MSAYWKRFQEEKPGRVGDYCYFTDEKMIDIHYGYFEIIDEKPVYYKINANNNSASGEVFNAEKFTFWCPPNQINSSWGKAY